MLTAVYKAELTGLAQTSIEYGLRRGAPVPVRADELDPPLRAKRGAFVTLKKQDDLRGCIGSIDARRPLAEDVAHNAFAAAFEDPRFQPVQESELSALQIHISVLSAPEPIRFDSEEELLHSIRPGIDGLILSEGSRQGTFLPSVWDALPEPRQFLAHLKLKAGLPLDYWSNTLGVARYTTESW